MTEFYVYALLNKGKEKWSKIRKERAPRNKGIKKTDKRRISESCLKREIELVVEINYDF